MFLNYICLSHDVVTCDVYHNISLISITVGTDHYSIIIFFVCFLWAGGGGIFVGDSFLGHETSFSPLGYA